MNDTAAPEFDELMSTKRVATMFGVTTETVRDWIAKGDLPAQQVATKPGRQGRWYIRRSDAVEFAKARFG